MSYNNQVFSISGYLETGLFLTGSLNDGKIISLSGALSSQITALSGNVISSSVDQQLIFRTDSKLTGSSDLLWSSTSGVLAIGSGSVLSNAYLSVSKNINDFIQINVQNFSNGGSASSDIVATANSGNNTSGFINLGINSAGYSDPSFSISSGGDGYVYINGGNLALGTQTTGKNLLIHINGTQSNNLVAYFNNTGIVFPSFKSTVFNNRDRNFGSINISNSFLAGKPNLSIYDGNDLRAERFGPSLYDKQIIAFLPGGAATQTVIGDTAANVGTVSNTATEVLGKYSLITPAAGLSAGTSSTTASIYRGSVTGKNGFFFTSTFNLSSAWSSGRATSSYAEPSGCRIFIGLTDQAVATQVGLNEPAGNMIGLNFLWASGGSVGTGQYMQNWAIRTANGTATATGTTSMNFQTGLYRFSMYCYPFPANTSVYWQLDHLSFNSGITGVVSTNLPTASTAMRSMAALGFVSGIKTIGIHNLYTEVSNPLYSNF